MAELLRLCGLRLPYGPPDTPVQGYSHAGLIRYSQVLQRFTVVLHLLPPTSYLITQQVRIISAQYKYYKESAKNNGQNKFHVRATPSTTTPHW